MTEIEKQRAMLRQDGYRDAAALIEHLSSTVNLSAEYLYLKAFAKQAFLDEECCREQLRALWTAYCFHASLNVDTAPYDSDLLSVWGELAEKDTGDWSDFNSFYNFMCKHLV